MCQAQCQLLGQSNPKWGRDLASQILPGTVRETGPARCGAGLHPARGAGLTDLMKVRKPVGPNFIVPLIPRNRINRFAILSTRRR